VGLGVEIIVTPGGRVEVVGKRMNIVQLMNTHVYKCKK
jgi:hypothetical protein